MTHIGTHTQSNTQSLPITLSTQRPGKRLSHETVLHPRRRASSRLCSSVAKIMKLCIVISKHAPCFSADFSSPYTLTVLFKILSKSISITKYISKIYFDYFCQAE